MSVLSNLSKGRIIGINFHAVHVYIAVQIRFTLLVLMQLSTAMCTGQAKMHSPPAHECK